MKKLTMTFIIIAVFLLSVSVFSFTACKTQEMAEKEMPAETMAAEESITGYMDVTVQEAKKLIDENPDLIIIDVSPKYAEGHLPGAIHYYFADGSLEKAIPSLDPEAKYLVYCHVDSVAIAGAQALIDAGFENVYRLEGNYAAWVDAGYPVEKEMSEETMAEEESTTGYMDISVQEAKKMIDENPDLIIIDVSPKYAEGHLPGAIHYYFADGSLEKAIPSLDPEAKYLVYCHVDSVAIAGAQALVDAGFENVYRLEGNYAAWVDAGYPVEK